MQIRHIFVLIISILLLVNALPTKSSKSYTIPLKKKRISNSLILHYASGPSNAINIKRATNVSLSDEFSHDDAYFCEITLSNKKFNVMIDTGFGDFIIPSVNCNSTACENKVKYNPVNDTTFRTRNKTFGYVYFGGYVFGIRGTTTSMNINGYNSGLNNDTGIIGNSGLDFGLVDVLPNNFEFDEFDGILGLASQNELVIQPEENFYENIQEDFSDPNQIFSLKIGREADGTESELTIGGIDQSKYTGELFLTEVVDNVYWSIRLDGFSINGISLDFQGRIGKIVSGLSPIIVPFDDAHKIYQQIHNATDNDGRFTMPCENEFKVKIKISSVDFDIDLRDLIDVQQLNDQQICNNNGWILGTTFLKNVYSVYDGSNHKIGIAKLNKSIT
ncbi:3200_t:CDS:2 [Dentiscutata erythropus]|uniref:3200_t:CDS:1 n=1 Tax=Dentiscutata erythropus TaxID=1348616 RepID=A0A9N9DXM0_9GLOM|nr:3200_t:CDS:2 [Dentiscutata erythropus]